MLTSFDVKRDTNLCEHLLGQIEVSAIRSIQLRYTNLCKQGIYMYIFYIIFIPPIYYIFSTAYV